MYTIILAATVSWALAQGYKFITRSAGSGHYTFQNLVDYGGMPSSHAAIVSCLCVLVGIQQGFRSTIFGLALIFAVFIVHDALRLRRIVESHSVFLNRLRKSLPSADQTRYQQQNERVGHRLIEVIVGIALGVAVALLFSKF